MSAFSTNATVRALRLTCSEPADALLLPVPAFPLPAEDSAQIAGAVDRIVAAACQRWKLSSELFIRFSQLDADGVNRLSSNGRAWRPHHGLGVWPNRGPERLWTRDDFISLQPDQKPRIAMEQMFHVGRASQADAREALFGSGALTEVLVANGAAFLDQTKKFYQPIQTQPAFQTFKMYVPLFDASAVTFASEEQLRLWFCGSQVYIRESAEDQGILIVSLEPLRPLLESIGAERRSNGEWLVPA